MEWSAAVRTLRKAFDKVLLERGFTYKGQNIWERQLTNWRARVAYEVIRSNGGRSRRLYFSPGLIQSKLLTEAEAKEMFRFTLSSSHDYAVYTVDFPTEIILEWEAHSPEEASALIPEIVKELENDWLPWQESRDADGSLTGPGVRRRHESVHKSLDYVP